MQNPIFLILETGWKHITSQKEIRLEHFCLMLIGEARSWYEPLVPLDDDWPALETKFR